VVILLTHDTTHLAATENEEIDWFPVHLQSSPEKRRRKVWNYAEKET
jgi:hypothetical protein